MIRKPVNKPRKAVKKEVYKSESEKPLKLKGKTVVNGGRC